MSFCRGSHSQHEKSPLAFVLGHVSGLVSPTAGWEYAEVFPWQVTVPTRAGNAVAFKARAGVVSRTAQCHLAFERLEDSRIILCQKLQLEITPFVCLLLLFQQGRRGRGRDDLDSCFHLTFRRKTWIVDCGGLLTANCRGNFYDLGVRVWFGLKPAGGIVICFTMEPNKEAIANDISFQAMTFVLPFFVAYPQFFTSNSLGSLLMTNEARVGWNGDKGPDQP